MPTLKITKEMFSVGMGPQVIMKVGCTRKTDLARDLRRRILLSIEGVSVQRLTLVPHKNEVIRCA